MPIPIRMALAALLLTLSLIVLEPHRSASAAPERHQQSAALVVAANATGPAAEPRFSPLGLAALVAAGWLPAVVLLARKRRPRQHAS